MIELLLLLIGGPTVRRNWWVLGVVGLMWLSLGTFFAINALSDEVRIPSTYFALPLVLDACVSFLAGLSGTATRRALRIGKAVALLTIVLLLIEAPWHSDLLIGFIVGTILIVDAGWRAISASIVRFPRWRYFIVLAGIEFLLGLWSFVPWPTYWQGEVGLDVGTLIIVTGIGLCIMAIRIWRMPPAVPLATLLAKSRPGGRTPITYKVQDGARPAAPDIIVHVWTPTGALAPINRGIERYVAARDANGAVSTGHAALEQGPDLYISHYPAVEIERSPEQFTHVLRATSDNDVQGLFKPSYREESAEWCPSSWQVRLSGLNEVALRDFWGAYREDTTYNLTYRNCSSAVAKALDAAVEGYFTTQARSPFFFFKLLFLPELWVAGLMRRRAAWMAWTPGMVLDYARALSQIVALTRASSGEKMP